MAKNSYQWDSYCSDEVGLYVEKIKLDLERQIFLRPVIQEFMEMEAPGKKVLDIGCGPAHWCCEAAKCGAKSVDGLDVHEGMVEVAQQATAQYSSVNICVGDVMDMPYDDNTFDVAISILVTCNLHPEALKKHFEELRRVLAPGGKALVHNMSDHAFHMLYLFGKDDEASVRKSIEQELQNNKKLSSLAEINDAVRGFGKVVRVCFAKDENGLLFLVNNSSQLINGQTIWFKTEYMTFPNYFYSNEYLTNQIVTAKLSINKIENPYTEEKRVAYNLANPKKQLSKTVIELPPSLIYHLHKCCEGLATS